MQKKVLKKYLLVVEDPVVMVQVFPVLFRLFPEIFLRILEGKVLHLKKTNTLNMGGALCRKGR